MWTFLFVVSNFFCLAWLARSDCKFVTNNGGSISDSQTLQYSYSHQACWVIFVPENKFVRIENISFSFNDMSCDYAYLNLKLNTLEKYKFCRTDSYKNPITSFSDVRIEFYFHNINGYYNSRIASFKLDYEIRDIQCTRNDSFHCTKYSCISRSKLCDGVKDCENGADEVGCETGILSIKGVGEARVRAVSSLTSKRTPLWGWQENTPRAITALYLAGGANFSGTSKEEELMAKQNELKTAIALLKNPISSEQLSIIINSLLVTCRSPNHFYGQNLVKRLKEQAEISDNTVHPIVYLTLCNANESWPSRASSDMENVFNSTADYHFVKDIQAYAVMALSCYANNSNFLNRIENSNMLPQVKKAIKIFKEHQLEDGSFGNVETTSLITQALISRGEEHSKDWKMNTTVKYLMRELNFTDVDFSKLYLTLPVFNGKSLTDVYKVNCSGTRKRVEDELISEVNDYAGPKMRIQYSLFVGDDKDIIHTLSVRVPENYTAHKVMLYAGEEDYKYKFEEKKISGKVYVSKIGRVSNDPESGKFWLLYLGSTNSTDHYNHTTTSPDHITLEDGDHLIMWFKTASI